MWAKPAWVPEASCSMENSFAPAQIKPPFYRVSRHGEQSLIIASCPHGQRTGCVSFNHSKLYTTAFLHMKQTSKKRGLTFFSPKSQPTPGILSPYRPTPYKTQATFPPALLSARDICVLLAVTCLGRAGLDRRKVIGR